MCLFQSVCGGFCVFVWCLVIIQYVFSSHTLPEAYFLENGLSQWWLAVRRAEGLSRKKGALFLGLKPEAPRHHLPLKNKGSCGWTLPLITNISVSFCSSHTSVVLTHAHALISATIQSQLWCVVFFCFLLSWTSGLVPPPVQALMGILSFEAHCILY